MNKKKLLEKVLSGSNNIRFSEFVILVEAFGFTLARTRGSHHIFRTSRHPANPEFAKLQRASQALSNPPIFTAC
jgi:predicted RNA binding protein YcfA (HicA-like mRNA interferase family)